ncbi:MAG: ribbon-helix-helix domain-containing protein [Actinomycetota bacterium]|nr:ribbon-helix-helix domain-containing protein [Actinomycetota bacterium]
MRTTVRIDDELYRAVKHQAARTGRTVGEIIEDAIRRAMAPSDSGRDSPLPPLPVYGGSGVLPGVDLSSNAALRDVMDADEPVDALR